MEITIDIPIWLILIFIFLILTNIVLALTHIILRLKIAEMEKKRSSIIKDMDKGELS